MMAFLLPILPLFAYFGLVVFALVVLAAAFWPRVLPLLAALLVDLDRRRAERLRMRSARLARRVPR
jgi:hypothetical protein